MRTSSLKTRLAKARVAAGIKQEDLAKILAVSIDQVRHLERGARPLTIPMAGYLSAVMGISADWLRGGGTDEPPVSMVGEPYGKETFEAWKSSKAIAATPDPLRAEAWREYISYLMTQVANAGPTVELVERIGIQVAAVIREDMKANTHRQLADSDFVGVDKFFRDLAAKSPNRSPLVKELKAKRSKRAPGSPGRS
jgi:transcriptional regulator with XRE-family HTH domain